MKKFICGFLCGAVLCTVIGAFAVNSIYENPYKITVNGAEKSIQGYNIDDYSYFKLRDIADAVGGFNVDFDNDTIILSTGEQVTDVTPSPASLPQGTIPDPIYIQVPAENGDYNVVVTNDEFEIPILKEVNGEFCVPESFIADKANEIVGYDKYSRGYKIYNMEIIPWTIVFDCGKSYPTLEYYYLNIAPWLQSLTQ